MTDNNLDFLEMSDEDISNMQSPNVPTTVEEDKEEDDTQGEDITTDTTEQSTSSQVEEGDDNSETQDVKEGEQTKVDAVSIDYEGEYKKILAPFKANGREFQVSNVDEAITLMQMGANYNKKMAALKPGLKVLKLLDTHGLMDEAELNYLIDLKQKNPEAISKLIKESGIDPLEIDVEKAATYKPKSYSISEQEFALDTMIEDLKDSPSYPRTIDVVGNKWDDVSKQTIARAPELLRIINDHMQSGVYDIIEKELDKQRTLGKLVGLSDIEAYRQVGDAIEARGGFNHLGRQGNPNHTKQKIDPPKPRKEDDPKLRDKKLAAAAPKPAASSSTTKGNFNPLSMSDEEFSKLSPKFV